VSAAIKRREFITLLGGAAAAWPLAARAQQGERMRRIGVLMPADDAEGQARLMTFGQGLALLGWTIGRNVRIDVRWSAGKADNIRKYATELVALAPDVILASGGSNVPPLLPRLRHRPDHAPQFLRPVKSARFCRLPLKRDVPNLRSGAANPVHTARLSC
jgi:putative tryptophan/tyrosine transport system substrate-binding protein